jgi:hypothetical protein
VLGSGLLLAATGMLIIGCLPLQFAWRAGILAAGLLPAYAGLARTWRAYRRSTGYRLYADGSIDVLQADGGRRPAVYAAGSVILPGVAWLCVRAADGASWGELVTGKARSNRDWRRLQVICRQIAAC